MSHLRSGRKIHDAVLSHVGGRDQVIDNLRSEIFQLHEEIKPQLTGSSMHSPTRELINRNNLNLKMLHQQAQDLENLIATRSTMGVGSVSRNSGTRLKTEFQNNHEMKLNLNKTLKLQEGGSKSYAQMVSPKSNFRDIGGRSIGVNGDLFKKRVGSVY